MATTQRITKKMTFFLQSLRPSFVFTSLWKHDVRNHFSAILSAINCFPPFAWETIEKGNQLNECCTPKWMYEMKWEKNGSFYRITISKEIVHLISFSSFVITSSAHPQYLLCFEIIASKWRFANEQTNNGWVGFSFFTFFLGIINRGSW